MEGSVPEPLWPFGLYFLCVLAIVGAMVALSALLGERHRGRETNEPFEAGIASAGSARVRLTARYYLVAAFFVIFDLEAAFLFVWAVAVRELGWPGYVEIAIFTGVLAVALAYIWRMGALDWGPRTGRKPFPAPESSR